MSRTVHVIQGLSAAGSLKQAIHPRPGELLANEDVLSCGPLQPIRSLDQWARDREAYWESVSPGRDERPFNRDLLANTQKFRELESCVVWLGVGAAELLLLVWLVQLLKLSGSRAQIRVIQFTRFGSHNEGAWALGLLHPEQLKDHPPAKELSSQAVSELEHLWGRVTSSDPAGLLSAACDDSALFPYIRASLQPLVRRFPDHRTGLGRWDFELLRKVKEKGPKGTRVIGHTLADNFDSDMVGDVYLFSRLRRLASAQLACPLVVMSGDPYRMRECEVSLTDAGESVLAGRSNAVEINGIDDWVLGVHLDSSRGSVWYQKEGALVTR
jgi:Domain of unknown function (DUF1835)